CGVGADFKKSGAIPLGQVRRFNGAYPFSDTYYLSNRQLSSDQFNRTAFTLNTYEADTIGKRQQ
ncbi:hypothetical protein ACLHZ7_22220, partial [Aeromonas salmonicida]|uniref:hypothetical protein n=1 Tax=Aeromonas salmonicida TaxID=645 RepID=UPI003D025434